MLSGSSGASIHRQARGRGLRGLERFALHALHAARIAAEQQADLVVGTVALVDAHFLALALAKDTPARRARPGRSDCSSSERILPRSELPGT